MLEQLSIKKWRLIKGLTQEDVSDILDISPKTVVSWEKEGATVKTVNIYALAKLYGVEVDQIKV